MDDFLSKCRVPLTNGAAIRKYLADYRATLEEIATFDYSASIVPIVESWGLDPLFKGRVLKRFKGKIEVQFCHLYSYPILT